MHYLGVDGGGTKTAFAVINHAGEVLSKATLGTCFHVQVGRQQFRQVLAEGIELCCTKAGIESTDLTSSFLGLPGYGEYAAEDEFVVGTVAELLPFTKVVIGNDVEAGWAGSLLCRPGVHLVAGTGAIGFGRDGLGASARANGWGHVCGDEGSAYWLGKKVLEGFTKQADGRFPQGPLYRIVRNRFGLRDDFEMIPQLHLDEYSERSQIAALAVLLYESAAAGDQYAVGCYESAADELCQTYTAIAAKLCFPEHRKIPVSYSGGVFGAGDFIVSPLRIRVAQANGELRSPILSPVLGAALYALHSAEEEAVTDAVIKNLVDNGGGEEG